MLADHDEVPSSPSREQSANPLLEHLGSPSQAEPPKKKTALELRRKRMAKMLQHSGSAAIKLERLPLSVIRWIFAFVWIISLVSLLISVGFTLVSYFSNQVTLSQITSSQFSFFFLIVLFYSIDGAVRTVAGTILFLLVIAYPQRVIVDSIRFNRVPLAEQVVICLALIVISILPAYSLYGVVDFWIRFSLSVSRSQGNAVLLIINTFVALENFSSAAVLLTRTMTVVVSAIIYAYMGGMAFFQSHVRGWDVEGLIVPIHTESSPVFEMAPQTSSRSTDTEEKTHVLPSDPAAAAASHAEETGLEVENLAARSHLVCCPALFFPSDPNLSNTGNNPTCLSWCFSQEQVLAIQKWWCLSYVFPLRCYVLKHVRAGAHNMRKSAGAERVRTGWRCVTNMLCVTVPAHIPVWFLSAVLLYAILGLVFTLTFQFQPSQIPVVGIITVIRVCLLSASVFVSKSQIVESYNITYTSSIASTPSDNTTSICSADALVFKRAICASCLAFLDVCLLVMVARLTRRSKSHLVSLPYAATRGRQLGFTVFQHLSFILTLTVFIGSVLCCSMSAVDTWTVASVTPVNGTGQATYSPPSAIAGLVVAYDPLITVGVSAFFVGWSPFFLLHVVWLLVMSFFYLPPDSYGAKGFFTRNSEDMGPGRSEYLIYVATEDQVDATLEFQRIIRRKEEVVARNKAQLDAQIRRGLGLQRLGQRSLSQRRMPSRDHPPIVRAVSELVGVVHNEKQTKRSLHHMGMSSVPDDEPELVCQIRANLLVLETEVLLYHFMHIAYDVADLGKDHRELSWAEKQALVEDRRFTLQAHLHDATTDTHCLVASSDDRIIVSFRGTVSLTNMKTDWDSGLVEHPLGALVDPLVEEDVLYKARAKYVAGLKPLVHGGFLKAYESVSGQLTELVQRLKAEDPKRVVFVTGHSLGGGLASVCAFELAVRLKLRASEISVTTFGCPKVGTYSFISRVRRRVPSARRFAMTGDIIVPMPMDPPFHSWTMLGWHHVGTEIMLDPTGNMIIRPSPVERFLLSNTISGPSNHFRLAYCSALMVWAVRSHAGEFKPEWWVRITNDFYSKNPGERLRNVAPNIRQRLLEDLVKPGTVYYVGKTRVRDFAVGTEEYLWGGEGGRNAQLVRALEELFRTAAAATVVLDEDKTEALIKAAMARGRVEPAPVEEKKDDDNDDDDGDLASFVSAKSEDAVEEHTAERVMTTTKDDGANDVELV